MRKDKAPRILNKVAGWDAVATQQRSTSEQQTADNDASRRTFVRAAPNATVAATPPSAGTGCLAERLTGCLVISSMPTTEDSFATMQVKILRTTAQHGSKPFVSRARWNGCSRPGRVGVWKFARTI